MKPGFSLGLFFRGHRDRADHTFVVGLAVRDAIVLIRPRLIERVRERLAGLEVYIKGGAIGHGMFFLANVYPGDSSARGDREFLRAKEIIVCFNLECWCRHSRCRRGCR